jgi:hypothetical protein
MSSKIEDKLMPAVSLNTKKEVLWVWRFKATHSLSTPGQRKLVNLNGARSRTLGRSRQQCVNNLPKAIQNERLCDAGKFSGGKKNAGWNISKFQGENYNQCFR